MRKLLLTALLVAVMTAGALAQCPDKVGVFMTANGTVLPGRVSEAWCGGLPGQPGNMENGYSWDGTALGTQWHVWGMAIDGSGAVLVSDDLNPVTGNGSRTYRTNYDGGQFLLDAMGPWGDGYTDVSGTITSYIVFTTITFVAGQQVGATSNVSFTGYFSECPAANNCRIEFAIANAIRVWMPGMGTMPTNYPALLCSATLGELFDACCLTISIQCTVDADPSTWGALKGMYR